MVSRRLSAEEAALWARVMAGVRPLHMGDAPAPPAPAPPVPQAAPRPPAKTSATPAIVKTTPPKPRTPGETLDGRWDRQLAQGAVSPDRTIDLHGHSLASAHAVLDFALDAAIRGGDRVLLLVTGKPPRPPSERPLPPTPYRGAIRDAVGDWLAGSRHCAAIAAVRTAHPRHGGAGALYIVLRKPRLPGKS